MSSGCREHATAVRIAVLLAAACLSGCGGSPYWLLKADHTSDPFNSVCDPTEDYVGGGAGAEWKHNRGSTTEIDGTLGKKRIRQCGWPAIDDTSTAAQLEVRHKVPMNFWK